MYFSELYYNLFKYILDLMKSHTHKNNKKNIELNFDTLEWTQIYIKPTLEAL